MRFIRASLLLLLVGSVGIVWAQDKPAEPADSSFKTVRAKAAQRRYELTLEKAEKDYQAAQKAAAEKYAEDLKQILAEVTRSGNLEEALKVRAAIESPKVAASGPFESIDRTRDGLLDATLVSDQSTITFSPDAATESTASTGSAFTASWGIMNDGRIVLWHADHGCDIIRLDGSRAYRLMYRAKPAQDEWVVRRKK